MRWPTSLAGGLLALLVLAVPARPANSELTAELPGGFPSAQTLKGWERIEGQAETVEVAVSYRLWVNPVRDAIYEITQYHFRDKRAGRAAEQSEKVLWNRRPGSREPLLCYERRAGAWVALPHGTDAYRVEMAQAIHVYQLHQAATREAAARTAH